jgi:hypothetical protein
VGYANAHDEDGQELVAAGKLEESLRLFRQACRIADAARLPDSSKALYRGHRDAIETALGLTGQPDIAND